MLSTVIQYLKEEHPCPHCKQNLTLCHAPPVHVGDGLGWGSEYLFICLNDECSLFVNGWEYIENQFGHVGSYRHMELPNGHENYNMMVGNKMAFTGSIVDVEEMKKTNKRYQQVKDAIAALDTCVADNNLEPVLFLLLGGHAGLEDRKRAADCLIPLNDLACIEPLRNHDFKDSYLEQAINMAIREILAKNFMKECPYCAELIKARATVCKHCQKEVA